MKFLLLIIAVCLSVHAQTTVTEPLILTPIGSTRFTGNLVITAPTLTYNGQLYTQWIQRIPISNGLVAGAAFSIALIPNVGSTPAGTSYTVRYEPQYQVGLGNQAYTRYWAVPATGPVSIAAVQTTVSSSPSSLFFPTQIDYSGAFAIPYSGSNTIGTELAPNITTTRKYLSMLGTSTAGAAPTWEAVVSGAAWGAITGTLSSQTDLDTALGLKAPLASPAFTGTLTAGDNAAFVINAAAPANSLTVSATGNVGIGTTGPGGKLEIVGGTTDSLRLKSDGGSDTNGLIRFLDAAGGSAATITQTNSTGVLNLTSSVIALSGNVGIGTTNPLERLHSLKSLTYDDVPTTGATRSTWWAGAADVGSDKLLKGVLNDGTTEKWSITRDGSVSFLGQFYLAQQTPASSTDTCTINQFVYDTGFVYVCTATNTWKRAPLSTW